VALPMVLVVVHLECSLGVVVVARSKEKLGMGRVAFGVLRTP
jgi:hypothetical protein